MLRLKLILISSLFLVVPEASVPALAQAVATAQIEGTVSDPSGAAVPGAEIVATQTTTGLIERTLSGSHGNYALPNLPVGSYALTVKAKGFATCVQSGIFLHVGDKPETKVILHLGAVSQQVQVTANASMVQEENTSVSQVVEQQRMVELPLDGRNPEDLIQLTGAADPLTTSVSGHTDLSPGTGGIGKQWADETPYSVAGGQANGTNWLLDGADNNDTAMNVPLAFPMPDAIQEFSVETSVREARSGLHPGAVVNVVTKSGTNQFHGDLFEFVRNGDLNARNFFAPTQDTLKRNQFGGTVGGPIKKNKLFAFFGYQATREIDISTGNIAYVPTAPMLNGDFSTFESAACQSNHVARTITNPVTGQPFPNDFVNPTSFNSSALRLLKYVPVASNPCGEVLYDLPSTGNENQYLGRVDWVQSQKNDLFTRAFIDDYSNPSVWNGTDILPSQRTGGLDRDESYVLGDNYTLSPTAFNSFHCAFTRLRIDRGAPADYLTDSSVGINTYETPINLLSIGVGSDFSTGGGGPRLLMVNNSWEATDDVDVIRGRQHFSFGFQVFRLQMNERNLYEQNGEFSFNGSYTGDPMVDYFLGDVNSLLQTGIEAEDWRQNVFQPYAQDAIHVNSHLDLSLGLRWSPWLPQHDDMGKGSHFSLADFEDGIKSSKYLNSPDGLLFAGDQGVPSNGITNEQLLNLEPHVGLAWDPTGRGVESIRADYSIQYDSPMLFYFERMASNPPWASTITLTDPPGGLSNPWLGYPGGDPFPLPYPPTKTNAAFPVDGTYVNAPLNMPMTNVQEWNLSFQRQAARNWVFSATYMGNKTTHVWIDGEEDPAVYIPGNCVAGQYGLTQPGPCSTIANTNQRRKLYLENPTEGQYYTTITLPDTGANAEYNSLLLSTEHRFSHEFTILSNYTWSHCISEGDFQGESLGIIYQDPYNRNADRGNCMFDHRGIFNTSFVIASPTLTQGWSRHLLDNWQLSSTFNYTSGTWMTPLTGVDDSRTGVDNDRPDVVANPYPSQQGPNDWTSAAAFVPNAIGTFGNAGRDSLLGPFSITLDTDLSRFFPVGETRKFEFRFEVFNALNDPDFSSPTMTLTSAEFGRITGAGNPRILQFALKFWF
jgi:Carboxypeptidase regulatory-like domain